MKHPLKTISKALGLLGSGLLLSACGAGSDGTTSAPNVDIPLEAPTVEIVGQNRSVEREHITLNAKADDIDGGIVSYEWSVNSADVELVDSTSSMLSFTAPSVDVDSSYTFNVTVTDNDGLTATKTIEFKVERISKKLHIVGQAIDQPLSYATIVIEVGTDRFEFIGEQGAGNKGANSLGYYVVEIEVDESNLDELVKFTAIGHPDFNPNTTLVSLSQSFNSLFAQSGKDEYLEKHENFDVNITNLTTAEYVLAQRLIETEITTEEQLQTIYNLLNQDDVMALATALKVAVDNPEFASSFIETNTLAFIENSSLVNEFLNSVNDQELIYNTRLEILRSADISEFPDYDDDKIIDDLDPDIDGDGHLNDDDFFPRNELEYAPRISMLIKGASETPDITLMDACLKSAQYKNPQIIVEEGKRWAEEVSSLDITTLDCSKNIAIENIDALKYFENLEFLSLANTAINKVDAIETLNKLTHLDISNTSVKDINVVANFTALQQFHVENTLVNGLTSLAGLHDLIIVNVNGSGINNVEALSGLTKLQKLYANNNQITSIDALMGLSQLEFLELANNKLISIPDLSNMQFLKTIELRSNLLNNISGLASLSYLTSLDLSSNQLEAVSALQHFTALTELNLSGNYIKNIDDIKDLAALKILKLSNNNIVNIEGMEQLQALQSLSLNVNELINIDPLITLTSLQDVNLGTNEITNISVFSNKEQLNSLDLSRNLIDDVSPLLSLTSLPKTLSISQNIYDCENESIVELKQKAEQQEITFSSNCRNYVVSDITLTDVRLVEYFKYSQLDGGAHSNKPNGREITVNSDYLGKEIISCLYHETKTVQPVCWAGLQNLSNQFLCSVNVGDTKVECKFHASSLLTEEMATKYSFTVDVDRTSAADKSFNSSFENRVILMVMNTSTRRYQHIDEGTSKSSPRSSLVCSPLVDGLSTCTMTSIDFIGEVSWQQDHELPVYPQCSGIQGRNIARCTPRRENIQDDPAIGEETEFSFDLDLSLYEFISREGADEKECEGTLCNGQ